ncbi:glycosyltransferase family 4 protein [Cyanobacteria bacterium FACHB-DQ100]|nr:glycosyltransferase family 4 protein [Cyanobacteria bacterium FACHB-DQ100]
MKVGFNARLLTAPTLRGWNRYTANLLAELAQLDVQLVLYSDRPIHPAHLERLPQSAYQVRLSPAMRYLQWEQVWLPQQCSKDQIDVLHCPMNFGLPAFNSCPQVLTLHDAIDQVYYAKHLSLFQRFSFAYRQSQLYHWIARTRSTHIITVSEFSKRDLVEHLKIPASKVSVIYEAADDHFYRSIADAVRSQYQLASPYVFYVGGLEQRKNIPFLVKAFAEANLQGVDLVLAGGQDQNQLRLLAESSGIAERIRFLGWVDDRDLPELYAGALCFVYASEYEGFGLQLCEAMAVGCPILAAQATCLPEVLGEGGILFSLENTQELSNCLRYINADPEYRSSLGQRAKLRSQHFSWQQTAQATIQVYERALGRSTKSQAFKRTASLANPDC